MYPLSSLRNIQYKGGVKLFRTESSLTFAAFICLVSVAVYLIYKGQKGPLPYVRPIAAIDALDEAVGRAAEMARPVHFAPGSGELNSEFASQTIAGLQILSYVARLTARYDTELIVTLWNSVAVPICQEVIRQSYLEEGKIDSYSPDCVMFLSDDQMAYTANAMGVIQQREIASNILVGPFYMESLMLAEAAFQVGAIQIAGTARMYQLPFFVAACDYTLLGEEMYTAGALIGKDAIRLNSIKAADWAKIVCLIVIGVGSLLETAGVHVITQFIKTYGN